MSSRRFALGAFLALSIAAAVTALGASAAPGRIAATSVPVDFTDESGDSGTAADIAKVSVSNDDKGQYTFLVHFATPYTGNAGFFVYLNTDVNTATGDPNAAGADYVLVDDYSQHTFYFEKWNGTAWDDAPTNATTSYAIANDNSSLAASVNRSEIGNSASFDFWVESIESDGSNGHFDDGPSGTGTWHYDLQTPLSLSVVAATANVPKAGKTWTMIAGVKRSDTGKTVGSEGTIVCSATSGKTKLKLVTRAFISSGAGGSSVAVCSFAVPKTLKHKVLHGTIAVSYGGLTAGRSFTTTAK